MGANLGGGLKRQQLAGGQFLHRAVAVGQAGVAVLGGIAVAEIGWLVARYTGLPRLFERLNERFLRTALAKII